jgi:hypothetical protein
MKNGTDITVFPPYTPPPPTTFRFTLTTPLIDPPLLISGHSFLVGRVSRDHLEIQPTTY